MESGRWGPEDPRMFPGYSTDHTAPSGNPKAKALGAGTARRAHSSYHLTPEPLPSHTQSEGPAGHALAT